MFALIRRRQSHRVRVADHAGASLGLLAGQFVEEADGRLRVAPVGHFGGQALHFYKDGETAGFIGSVFGAIVLLVLARLLSAR